ncbi:MAG TPA: GNAT family N-acetyltransferase [Ignavibacteria bacterium]|nr:GNAT family N-acetyltransferase [Ignavibacteria bacterium]
MIETDRLILKPLTYSQLIKYIRNDNSLEKELNINESSRNVSAELKEALELTILPNTSDTNKNYFYSTLWVIILKADNKMVGDLCIFGEPDEEGEIKIGYGIYEEFRMKGYMTEAVNGIISWAGSQPKVNSIFASTEISNNASFKVLEKNKFLKVHETETMLSWRFILR